MGLVDQASTLFSCILVSQIGRQCLCRIYGIGLKVMWACMFVHVQEVKLQEPSISNGGGKRSEVTCALVLTVTVAVLGSCTQFGYNTGVINNPKKASVDLSHYISLEKLFLHQHICINAGPLTHHIHTYPHTCTGHY